MRTKTRINPLEKLYFQWLARKVNNSRHTKNNLLWYLYEKDFYGYIPNDDNREVDAINQRDTFEDEHNTYIGDILQGKPPSMLEMMVSLAERMDHILYDYNKGSQVDRWFWILVENLGLDNDLENNDNLIDIFLKRQYSASGEGGLFPLKNKTKEDQRKVELWYQMHRYLSENF